LDRKCEVGAENISPHCDWLTVSLGRKQVVRKVYVMVLGRKRKTFLSPR